MQFTSSTVLDSTVKKQKSLIKAKILVQERFRKLCYFLHCNQAGSKQVHLCVCFRENTA